MPLTEDRTAPRGGLDTAGTTSLRPSTGPRTWRTGAGNRQKVVVVVPAYKEVDSLPRVLDALSRQTRPPDRIVLTLDPHKDRQRTGELERMGRGSGAEIRHSVGNRHKKAGNLNGALAELLPTLADDDAVLVQDADT